MWGHVPRPCLAELRKSDRRGRISAKAAIAGRSASSLLSLSLALHDGATFAEVDARLEAGGREGAASVLGLRSGGSPRELRMRTMSELPPQVSRIERTVDAKRFSLVGSLMGGTAM